MRFATHAASRPTPGSTSEVAVSIALAVALVLSRLRAVLVVTIVVAFVFAIADVREVFHQSGERPGVAAIAGAVALLHAVAAVAAGGLCGYELAGTRRYTGPDNDSA